MDTAGSWYKRGMSKTRVWVVFALFAFVAGGCGKSKDAGDNKAAPPAKQAEPANEPAAEKPPAPAPKVEGAIGEALTAYTAIHDVLVVDKTDRVAAAATKLAESAAKAGESAADAVKPHYAELTKAAGELAKAADLEAVRLAFGEVSRHLVMIMEMSPELASAHHVFECPMAKGYKKWVQASAKLANPYMGSAMPECGAEVAFAKGDMAKGDMAKGDMAKGDKN